MIKLKTTNQEIIKCKCGDENKSTAKYCKNCGEELKKPELPTGPFVCPKCSYDCKKRVNFCQKCNYKFNHPPGLI